MAAIGALLCEAAGATVDATVWDDAVTGTITEEAVVVDVVVVVLVVDVVATVDLTECARST